MSVETHDHLTEVAGSTGQRWDDGQRTSVDPVDPAPVHRRSEHAPNPGVVAELSQIQHLIDAAELAGTPAERYLGAHRAAQRVAVLVVASRPARTSRSGAVINLRSGPTNLWTALAAVAPECGEWAAYFAATQYKREAVAAGAVALVTEREADDLVRDAQGFLDLIDRRVRRAGTPANPARNRARDG